MSICNSLSSILLCNLKLKFNFFFIHQIESLRKWPPALATDRVCIKRYETTDTHGRNVVINKGDGIWIPIYGIHRDSDHYPNPEKFDPDRFSDENKNSINPFTYLPFGSGPRNCIGKINATWLGSILILLIFNFFIGSRFALMESKALIFYLLTSFTFEVAETTQIPLKLACAGFSIRSEKGFNIHLKPRN